MGKLIVNADDFGYTLGTTHGILEAHKNGIVSSTTALTVSDYFFESMEYAKNVPSLGIGVHLALTLKGATPLRNDLLSLVQADGTFHSQEDFLEKVDPEEVYLEWDSQIARFFASGRIPTHLDSHHNVHGTAPLLPIAIRLANKYELPLRKILRGQPAERLEELYHPLNKKTEHYIGSFYGEKVTEKELLLILKQVSDSEDTFEMSCHPGFIDPLLNQMTSYLSERLTEYELLTSEFIESYVEENKIDLTNFLYVKQSN